MQMISFMILLFVMNDEIIVCGSIIVAEVILVPFTILEMYIFEMIVVLLWLTLSMWFEPGFILVIP